jgi:hypothetical protein
MKQKIWLYRGLIIIVCALFVISFLLHWWTTSITIQGFAQQVNAVRIFAYGLRHTLVEYRVYILDDEIPYFQTLLAFMYLIVSLAVALGSTWIKGRKGFWLLLACGIGYLVYISAATWIIIQRLDTFDIVLQGASRVSYNVRNVSFQSSLGLGFYLAYVSGVLMILLAFLRRLFIKSGD